MSERLILITGATGYVGTVLAPLIAQKHRVRAFDTQLFGNAIGDVPNIESVKGDVTNWSDVASAMNGVTDVVHLAGIVTDHLVDMNVPKGFQVNVTGTEILVSNALEAGVKRFIYVSSSSVYGWAAERMGDVDEWMTPRPKTAYAMQKLAAERIVETFGVAAGAYCIVRPATMCGPAPRPRLDPLINVFSKQAYFDQRITVHGGSQYRSNVHVRDTADVLAMLLDAPAEMITGGVFNITAGNMTVGEAAEMVAAVYEQRYNRQVSIEIQAVSDARSYRLTARQLMATFGWEPKRTMADAVNDMFDLFETGGINPKDSLYWQTERMRPLMEART